MSGIDISAWTSKTSTSPSVRQEGTDVFAVFRQIPRAGPHEVHWWQLNLLQELRNFVRFCGMGGRLSIHPRPAFSVEGQVGMSTSICSPGWGTGCSRAATSTSYKNLGKFDRARLDMASTGSPSTHVQGPSLRPSGRHTNTLDSDLPHVATFGNVYKRPPWPVGMERALLGSSFSTRPAPRPAAHDVRGLQLHPSTRTSTSPSSTVRRLSLHATAWATRATGSALHRRPAHRAGALDQH